MRFKLKQIAFAGLLACLGASGFASNYFFVQPKSFEMNKASPISVYFSESAIPVGAVGSPYHGIGFNLSPLVAISGDPELNKSLVTFAVTSGSLPDGLTLSSAGILSGAPTTAGSAQIQLTASYKNATGTKNYTVTVASASTSVGQVAYTSAGTFSFIVPAGVTSVSVVAVGGGEFRQNAGDGSALAWKNNIAVVPGQAYAVVVGAASTKFSYTPSVGPSYFINDTTVMARVGSFIGDGGGMGGVGNIGWGGVCSTGGGAGGYTGAGGNGARLTTDPSTTVQATAGSGGGGGGGATTDYYYGGPYGCGGGGGVGLYGQGANGFADVISVDGLSGGGGSGGSNGFYSTVTAAGTYGGGGAIFSSGYHGSGGGAVRIIWGPGRAFPSTLTADQ